MANGGALRNYLKLNFLNMRGNDKLRLAKQIAEGMMCLHQKHIIHRNLVRMALLLFREYLLYDFEQILIII